METVGLWQLAEEQQPYMTAMRRLFHTEPELSGREFKTRETLCKELTDMGIPYTLLPGTGLIAQVKGRLPGPSRLLRSDMDALQPGAGESMRVQKQGGLSRLWS